MLHHIFQKVLLPAALAGTMLAGTSAPAVSLAAQAGGTGCHTAGQLSRRLAARQRQRRDRRQGRQSGLDHRLQLVRLQCRQPGIRRGLVAEYARYAPADRRPRVQLSPDSHVHRDFAPMEKR